MGKGFVWPDQPGLKNPVVICNQGKWGWRTGGDEMKEEKSSPHSFLGLMDGNTLRSLLSCPGWAHQQPDSCIQLEEFQHPFSWGGQVGHKTAEFGNCCVTRHHKTSSLWCLGWKFRSYMLSVNNLRFPWQTRQCFVSSPCIGRVPITIDEQAQRLQAFRNTWDVSSWPTSWKPG